MLKKSLGFFLLIITLTSTFAQQNSTKSLLVLPFNRIGIEEVPSSTAKSILTRELEKNGKFSSIKDYKDKQMDCENCLQKNFAVEIGKENNSDEVLGVELASLGEVIIIQYILVDTKKDSLLLSEQTKALSLEDLERVMKRLALSVSTNKPILEGAEVGNIMESESEEELKRYSSGYFGLAFGYLYPKNGYDNDDRSFTMDLEIGYDIEDYTVGLNFGARSGFFANLFGEYNLTRTDICPYIGGGFGFHWVSHNDVYDYTITNYDGFESYSTRKELKTDGFDLSINTGVKFLRTYKFQLFANLAYEFTFNDFDDKALIFTIGILF